jgi:hypothetical protein
MTQRLSCTGAWHMPPLPLTRYRLTAAFRSDLTLPDYAGSLLRGVFGAALKRTACLTGLPECKPCTLWRTCPYPAIFEMPPRQTLLAQRFSQVPNPYVIEPPSLHTRHLPAGQTLSWHIVLAGADTLRQLPLVAQAWQRSLRQGWSKESVRASGELLALDAIDARGALHQAWDFSCGRLIAHPTEWQWIPERQHGSTTATIHLQTPLRLQNDGRPLGVRELSPRVFITHLLRRVRLMLELHLGVTHPPLDIPALLTHAETLHADHRALHWKDWTRYSSRQKQEMTLGGVVGPWVLHGDLFPLMPWLELGQWLHLGKNATMGMGAYQLEFHSADADDHESCIA